MNAVTPVDRKTSGEASRSDLATRLRAEAAGLVQDLTSKGVTEQDAAFTWTAGIAASFVHLGGMLDYVGRELDGIIKTQAESRSSFRTDVVDAARAQFKVIDAEITKMQLARVHLEVSLQRQINDTVRSLGDQIAAANKTANVIFQKRWNLRQNLVAALMCGALLLSCVIGGYLWRSFQEGNAIAGRYACEQSPLIVVTANGSELACPIKDLVSARVLSALDHHVLRTASPARGSTR